MSQVIWTFTGNRPQFLPCKWDENHPWLIELLARLDTFVKEGKPTIIRSGMALGWDIWAAECAIANNVELHAYIPCPEQPDRWGWAAKKRYKEILKKAAKQTTISATYTPDCFLERNKVMVDGCDLVLSLLDPDKSDGGTVHTVKYAISKGCEVINFWPNAVSADVVSGDRIPFA